MRLYFKANELTPMSTRQFPIWTKMALIQKNFFCLKMHFFCTKRRRYSFGLAGNLSFCFYFGKTGMKTSFCMLGQKTYVLPVKGRYSALFEWGGWGRGSCPFPKVCLDPSRNSLHWSGFYHRMNVNCLLTVCTVYTMNFMWTKLMQKLMLLTLYISFKTDWFTFKHCEFCQ